MSIGKESLDDIQLVPLMDTLRVQKIDDSEYFSEKYNGYISNSRLSLINPEQDNDPEAFFEGLGKHNKYSDALIFGSAVHELVLQPELFHLCECVDRPTAKAGFVADELYNTFTNESFTDTDRRSAIFLASNKIDYYKGRLDDDKIDTLISKCLPYWRARRSYESRELASTPIYLDPKSRERVKSCVHALETNKLVQKLLHPTGLVLDPVSENEQAILLDVEVRVPNYEPFIFRLKAKLDNYTVDSETNSVVVNDVKTIGKILSEFQNNFEKFHYHRELAIYSWLMSLVAKKYYSMDNCTVISNCLVVSTIPDFYTKVYTLNRGDFKKGWEEFKILLKLAAHYYSKGYRFS